MDFMKVLDQTVREIKREVNIKVLKVPEIEQKVLDATNNEPWGPHGSDLTEIANATKKFTECQLIMSTLWTRLGDGGRNWRHVYKALAVIEYLIAHGSERALDDIIEHTFQISSLASFEYVEPNGKDTGINVRKKAETMTNLLSNKDKIQEARNKAAANRDKYFGLSSTGITYKSSTASSGFGSSSFQPGERYGGLNARKEGEMFKDSYSNRDRFGGDELNKDSRAKSHREYGTGNDSNKVRKGSHSRSASQDTPLSSTSRASSKLDHSDDNYGTVPSQTSGAPGSLEDDDFDDFDPRGTSNSGAAAANVKEVNLFGDFMDAPAISPPKMSTTNGDAASEVDLFADADFVSASPNIDASVNFQPQADVDLFASQPTTFTSASSSGVDLFAAPNPPVPSASSSGVDLFAAAPNPPVQSETKSPKIETSSHAVDPFATVPLNNFDGSDLFGAFSSHTDQVPAEHIKSSVSEGNLNSLSQKPSVGKNPSFKKDPFQVKSGIWSDSLTRGLIDLNITAPKKVNLTDIGIVGGLTDGSDEKEKGPPTTTYMGRAMGSGSGLGRSMSGFTPTHSGGGVGTGIDDDFFASLGSYKK